MEGNDLALIDAYLQQRQDAETGRMMIADSIGRERRLLLWFEHIRAMLDAIETYPGIPNAVPTGTVRLWLEAIKRDEAPRIHEPEVQEIIGNG